MAYALAKRAGRRLRRARNGAIDPVRAWGMSAFWVSAAAGVALWAYERLGMKPLVITGLDWWVELLVVTIGFLVADRFVAHLRFGREVRFLTMSVVPLTVGLFIVALPNLIVARGVTGIVNGVIRHQRDVVGIAWSLAQPMASVASAVAVVIVVTYQEGVAEIIGDLGPTAFLVAFGATQVSHVVTHVIHAFTIPSVPPGAMRRERLEVFGFDSLVTMLNAGLGVLIVEAIHKESFLVAAFGVLPIAILVFGYRTYAQARQERDRLRALYEATRDLHASPQVELSMRAAAGHARDIFEGEFCEIVLLLGDEPRAYRTIVGPGVAYEMMVPVELEKWRLLWNEALDKEKPFIADRITSLASSVEERRLPIESAMVAPIITDGHQTGLLVVANPVSETSVFAEADLELLSTLAGQVAVAVENGRLEDSLAALTELKEELRHQALHDGLTGLANRTLFRERVSHAMQLSRRTGGQIAVLFIDLDDFKNVNDSLGHSAGDELLSAVAERLRDQCRPEDTIARLGGDEFGILLEEIDGPATATAIAQRVLDGLGKPFTIGGRQVMSPGSIGIAFGRYGDTANQVLRDADAAMYSAKRGGKAAFRLFESSMHAEVVAQLQMRADLEAAIRKDELRLAYQPIVDLEKGSILGFEALVRWEHTLRGWLSPALFVPFAEETGLINEIGRWVLNEAIRQCGEWKRLHGDALEPFKVTVNLSTKQLEEPGLAQEVAAALERHDVDPSLVVLEITETTMMRVEPDRLHELRDLGIMLAIDDFGTGYSSLASLHKLPVDVLKIDRLFVTSLEDEEDASPFVSTIVSLGNALGMQIIVEGIETMEQLDRIKELGCESAQGYYFSKPLRPRDAGKVLKRQVDQGTPAYDLEDLAYRTEKRRLASAG